MASDFNPGQSDDIRYEQHSAQETCLLTSSVSAYLQGVQSWEELDSTCGSLGHSRHRTAAGPKNNMKFRVKFSLTEQNVRQFPPQ